MTYQYLQLAHIHTNTHARALGQCIKREHENNEPRQMLSAMQTNKRISSSMPHNKQQQQQIVFIFRLACKQQPPFDNKILDWPILINPDKNAFSHSSLYLHANNRILFGGKAPHRETANIKLYTFTISMHAYVSSINAKTKTESRFYHIPCAGVCC